VPNRVLRSYTELYGVNGSLKRSNEDNGAERRAGALDARCGRPSGLMISRNDRWSLSRREAGRARVAALRAARGPARSGIPSGSSDSSPWNPGSHGSSSRPACRPATRARLVSHRLPDDVIMRPAAGKTNAGSGALRYPPLSSLLRFEIRGPRLPSIRPGEECPQPPPDEDQRAEHGDHVVAPVAGGRPRNNYAISRSNYREAPSMRAASSITRDQDPRRQTRSICALILAV
jgi:hypothetical protein